MKLSTKIIDRIVAGVAWTAVTANLVGYALYYPVELKVKPGTIVLPSVQEQTYAVTPEGKVRFGVLGPHNLVPLPSTVHVPLKDVVVGYLQKKDVATEYAIKEVELLF